MSETENLNFATYKDIPVETLKLLGLIKKDGSVDFQKGRGYSWGTGTHNFALWSYYGGMYRLTRKATALFATEFVANQPKSAKEIEEELKQKAMSLFVQKIERYGAQFVLNALKSTEEKTKVTENLLFDPNENATEILSVFIRQMIGVSEIKIIETSKIDDFINKCESGSLKYNYNRMRELKKLKEEKQ